MEYLETSPNSLYCGVGSMTVYHSRFIHSSETIIDSSIGAKTGFTHRELVSTHSLSRPYKNVFTSSDPGRHL